MKTESFIKLLVPSFLQAAKRQNCTSCGGSGKQGGKDCTSCAGTGTETVWS